MPASWQLAFNTLTARRTRTVLLVAAVAIAASLVVAVSCGIASGQRAMEHSLKRVLGAAEARIVHQFNGRFDESLLEQVRGWDEVTAATGRLLGSMTLIRKDRATDPETGRLLRETPQAIGVSIDNDDAFQTLELREGRPLEGPDEILLDPMTADALDASIGNVLVVQRFGAPIELTVVGIYERRALQVLQRMRVQVDRRTVAEAISKPASLTLILIELADGVDTDAFCEKYAPQITEPLALEPAELVRAGFDQRMAAGRSGLLIASVLTFLCASFIIVTGMTTSVTEQQRQMAIARCVGASRGQLFSAQLFTGVIVAVIGVVIGIPLGIGLSASLVWWFRDVLPAGLAISQLGLVLAVVGALASGVLGALFPAWMSSRVSPLEAMTVAARPPRRAALIITTIWALVLIGGQLALLTIEDNTLRFRMYAFAGLPMLLIGYFLLATPLLAVLGRLLSGPLARALAIPRDMLAGSISATPFRHGFTAGALMVGIAILVSTWATGRALLTDWIDQIRFADGFAYRITGVDDQQQKDIAALPFVESICPIGHLPVRIVGRGAFNVAGVTPPTICVGFNPETFFDMNEVEWVQGDRTSAVPRLRAGDAVVVEERFLVAHELGVGDTITLGMGSIEHTYEIVGVVSSAGLDIVTQMFGLRSQYMEFATSCVFVDRETVRNHFDNNDTYMVQVNIADSVTDEQAIAAIEEAAPGVRFFSGRWIVERITEIASTLLGVNSVIAFAALVLACIGVGNVMLANIHARRYEFGVLRAIGGSRSMIARLLLVESAMLATVGLIIGATIGMHLSWVETVHYRNLMGINVRSSLPLLPIALGWIALLAGALIATAPGIRRIQRPQPALLLAGGRND